MELNEIINDFDVNKFTEFFRGKNRSFALRQELSKEIIIAIENKN